MKEKKGEVYNISNERSIASIYDVAKTCADIANTEIIFELPDEIEEKGFSHSMDCILDNKKLKIIRLGSKVFFIRRVKRNNRDFEGKGRS